jgi:hypothetical protein
MSGRLLFLNLMLAAGVMLAGWKLYANYQADRAQREAFLRRPVNPADVAAHTPSEAAKPVQPASFLQVAQQMLFSKDRNPNVIIEIEPPKVPPPPPPIPAFPAAYGILSFGGDVVVLLSDAGKQKGYRLGDSVGPFKLSAIKGEDLTFEWNGQVFKKTLTELKKLAATAPPPSTSASASNGSTGASVSSASLSPAEAAAKVVSQQVTQEAYKNELSRVAGPAASGPAGADRVCDPSDTSPAGTIQAGYRKRLIQTPFGNNCIWEPVR